MAALLTHKRYVSPATAAQAPLLDFAARDYLDLRTGDDDPTSTTVHLRRSQSGSLAPYEELVLARVAEKVVDGEVRLPALGFDSKAEAGNWGARVQAAVYEEARQHGLITERLSCAQRRLLVVAAVVATLAVTAAVLLEQPPEDRTDLAVGLLALRWPYCLVRASSTSAGRSRSPARCCASTSGSRHSTSARARHPRRSTTWCSTTGTPRS